MICYNLNSCIWRSTSLLVFILIVIAAGCNEHIFFLLTKGEKHFEFPAPREKGKMSSCKEACSRKTDLRRKTGKRKVTPTYVSHSLELFEAKIEKAIDKWTTSDNEKKN